MTKVSVGRYISALYRHIQIRHNREFARFGFGSGQQMFFMYLMHHPGSTQKEMSRDLAIDKATTARAVKKLMELGYIRQEQDDRDRRSYRVYLTRKGISIQPDVQEILKDTTKILTQGMSLQEERLARVSLEKMFHNVTASNKTRKSHEE